MADSGSLLYLPTKRGDAEARSYTGPLSLSFDEEVEQFTPDYHNKMEGLDSWPDVTMVARVDLHRIWRNGQFLVTLKVFAIDRVEPRS